MRPRIQVATDQLGWAFGFHYKDLVKHFPQYEWSYGHVIKNADAVYCLELGRDVPNRLVKNTALSIRSNRQYGHTEVSGECFWPDFCRDHYPDQLKERLNQRFNKVYGISWQIVNDLLPFRSDVEYLPQGIDTDWFSPASKKREGSKLVVGWAGTPRPEKRFATAVAAGSVYDFKMAVGGIKIDDYDLLIPWEEMPDFYRHLDVLLCASTNEGSCRTVLEAMACGVPVISTAVGEAPQLIEPGVNGLIVSLNGLEPDNVGKLVNAIELFREISSLRDMRKAARQSVMKYSWPNVWDRYETVFEKALA